MDDNMEQPERRVNTANAIINLTHQIELLITSQSNCNKELLQGITDLKAVTEKQSKTLYGNGTAGLCENVRTVTEKISDTQEEIDKAKARIWGLIFAAIAFIVVEIIKII